MIYFTADTHFGHGNIIKLCNRPFESGKEHDWELIERWNSLVRPEDTVYHLGDFGFGSPNFLSSIRERLNGKIHMVWGNHDKRQKRKKISHLFDTVQDYLEITVQEPAEPKPKKVFIVMFHYPILSWNRKHYGSIQLHGHYHNAALPFLLKNTVNVGVDNWNFFPVSYEQIKSFLAREGE